MNLREALALARYAREQPGGVEAIPMPEGDGWVLYLNIAHTGIPAVTVSIYRKSAVQLSIETLKGVLRQRLQAGGETDAATSSLFDRG